MTVVDLGTFCMDPWSWGCILDQTEVRQALNHPEWL